MAFWRKINHWFRKSKYEFLLGFHYNHWCILLNNKVIWYFRTFSFWLGMPNVWKCLECLVITTAALPHLQVINPMGKWTNVRQATYTMHKIVSWSRCYRLNQESCTSIDSSKKLTKTVAYRSFVVSSQYQFAWMSSFVVNWLKQPLTVHLNEYTSTSIYEYQRVENVRLLKQGINAQRPLQVFWL